MAKDIKVDLAGLTNALTDIIVNVTEEELASLNIKKGAGKNLKSINFEKFSEILSHKEYLECPAGSPANTVINAAMMNLNTALFGTIGNDDAGLNYNLYLEKCGVKSFLGRCKGNSGKCYVLLTPDNERTSVADIGVANLFEFQIRKIQNLKVFHTSGYEVISNPTRALETLRYAKSLGAKISFDLADEKMVRKERAVIEKIVEMTDILFMTQEEACEFGLCPSIQVLEKMSKTCSFVALKKGSKGSIIRRGQEQYDIPIIPVEVVSTCGAGDAYAAGFIYGYLKNFSLYNCGLMASKVASKVCSIKHSHLLDNSCLLDNS